MEYGNIFRNYYHILTLKYGNKKNLWLEEEREKIRQYKNKIPTWGLKKRKKKKKKGKKKERNKRKEEKETKVGKASPSWTVFPALRGPRQELACIDGMMGNGWTGRRSQKIPCIFKISQKLFDIFF